MPVAIHVKQKNTKEWRFENAASKERRLHPILRLWSFGVRPEVYLAITAAWEEDLRWKEGNCSWPEVKIAGSQMQSAP